MQKHWDGFKVTIPFNFMFPHLESTFVPILFIFLVIKESRMPLIQVQHIHLYTELNAHHPNQHPAKIK